MKSSSESKKRKAEKTPTPRREKSLRRSVHNELNEVSVTLKKLPIDKLSREKLSTNSEIRTSRRTPRNLRKEKLVDTDTPSPGVSLRKRRKQ